MSTTCRRPLPGARVSRLLVAAIAWITLSASPALAVSIRDLVALSQAGLSDDVLIALMEADGTVFNLDGPKILELRAQGVSERVITAMIKNGPRLGVPSAQDVAPAIPPAAQEPGNDPPSLVIIGEKPAAPPVVAVQQTVIMVPWMLPVVAGPAVPTAQPVPTLPGYRGFGRFINDGWIDGRPPSGAH